MKEQGSIIPMCIYHNINYNTNTYLGHITPPMKVKLDDGSFTYRCVERPKLYHNWFLYGVFYVVNPSFRPIPEGMKMYCAQKATGFPYNTQNVYLQYDPYNIKEDCFYFITYNKRIPNTVELYFHKLGKNIFPSFDKNPPTDNPDWVQTTMSPVYVMTKDSVGIDLFNPKNTEILKFKCINGRCTPWVKNIPNLYDENPDEELLKLDDCIIYCNELVLANKYQRRATQLLEHVNTTTKRKPVLSTFLKNTSSKIIGIVLFLFLLLFFGVMYFISKRSNKIQQRYNIKE